MSEAEYMDEWADDFDDDDYDEDWYYLDGAYR